LAGNWELNGMHTTFSVQQIKFEFLCYLKEFGADVDRWFIGTCEDPNLALFQAEVVDREVDIWLWKPALTAKAAANVRDYFIEKFHLKISNASVSSDHSKFVFLYRPKGKP
jgi:hypothetical protein